MKRKNILPLQQKHINPSSSISSSSLEQPLSTYKRLRVHPKEASGQPTKDQKGKNSSSSAPPHHLSMVDQLSNQLRLSVDENISQQELIYSEKRQKLLEETDQQLRKYRDYLNQYHNSKIPFLKRFQDHQYLLDNQLNKLIQGMDNESSKINSTKADANDLNQYFQTQAEILRTKMEAFEKEFD